jgi:hypothetical protein
MSASPTPPPPVYLGPNPVLRQIVADIKGFSLTQVFPSLIMAVGAFIYAWWAGQVSSFGQGLKFILYSLVAGLLLYLLLAVIRAPIIVIGWHLRQMSTLSLKLAEVGSLPLATQIVPTNSFSGFRVIHEEASKLEFEVWYFYDGALGGEDICILASLENNGVPVGVVKGVQVAHDMDIVNHQALARMTLTCNPSESETSIKSTHVVLSMKNYEKDAIFYRQLIPYNKVWELR